MGEIKLCKCGCGKPTTMIKKNNDSRGLIKGEFNDYLHHHHTKNKPKTYNQKKKMSQTRKLWYKNNPDKAELKRLKMKETKIREEIYNNEKNINWHGGISRKPKNYRYNPKLREGIRNRDGYRCQKCFRHKSELNSSLEIHHIDFNKRNDNPLNMITLCKGCHSQLSFNREQWINHFQNLMNERR